MDGFSHTDALSASLLSDLNKEHIMRVAEEAVNDASILEALFDLMSCENSSLRWRAAWALEKVSLLQPSLLEFRYQDITILAMSPNITEGHRRLLLGILYHLPEREEVDVAFFNFLLDKMVSLQSPSGVQALSIKLAFRVSQTSCDLHNELVCMLRNMEIEYYPAGVRSAVRNCLRKSKK